MAANWVGGSTIHRSLGHGASSASSVGSASHRPSIKRGEARGRSRTKPSICYPQSSQACSSPELEGRKEASSQHNTDRSASSEPELCGPWRSAGNGALGCRTPFRRLMQMDAWQRTWVVCAQPIETRPRCSLTTPAARVVLRSSHVQRLLHHQ